MLNTTNEGATRTSPTYGSTHAAELSSIQNQGVTHKRVWENHVLVVVGLAQAVFTGPWNHSPGLLPTLPTVEKHVIQPPNNWLESGKSNGGSNFLQSNFDWP